MIDPTYFLFGPSPIDFNDDGQLVPTCIYFLFDGGWNIHIKYSGDLSWEKCVLRRTGGSSDRRSKINRRIMSRGLTIEVADLIVEMNEKANYYTDKVSGRFLWNLLVEEGFTQV